MIENDDYIIKQCYFCDYPYNVPADYEEKINENGVYHSNIKKYKDLWVCFSCENNSLRWTDFSYQENGECCICFEDKILLKLPTCIHKICIQCCKTIYYGSTDSEPPNINKKIKLHIFIYILF
jgi:hypothetical protein